MKSQQKSHGINLYATVRKAQSLLNKKDKKKLNSFLSAQIFLNFLDLLGLLFIVALVTKSSEKITTVKKSTFMDSILTNLSFFGDNEELIIFWLALGSLMVFLIKTFLSMVVTKQTLKFLSKISADLSSQTLLKINQSPQKLGESIFASELIFSLSTGIPKLIFSILGSVSVLLADFTLFLFIVALLLFYNAQVTLISIFVFGVAFTITHRVVSNKIFNLGRTSNQNDLLANNIILSFYRNRKEFQVKGNSSKILAMYDEKRKKHLNSVGHLIFLQNSSRYLLEIIVPVGVFAVVTYQLIFKSSLEGSLSLGVFLVAATRMAPALIKIQSNIIVMKSVSGELTEVIQMLEKLNVIELEKRSKSSTIEIFDRTIAIEFQNVHFRHPGDNSCCIEDVSFKIRKGDIVAIVGPSGSGKTTLIDLSLGLLESQKGKILLFGEEPKLAIEKNPGKFAYVPQDPMIIGGTIKDNILLGSQNIEESDDSLWRALSLVQMKEFVAGLENGLETQIGEFGVNLSGGQRQRLGMARALVSDPNLLVLDEVTSALDIETENLIKQMLTHLKGKKTVILVSHSRNFIEVANQTIKFDGRGLSVHIQD